MPVVTYSRTGCTYFCWTEQRALILAAALRTTDVDSVTYTRRWPGWSVETYMKDDPAKRWARAVKFEMEAAL